MSTVGLAFSGTIEWFGSYIDNMLSVQVLEHQEKHGPFNVLTAWSIPQSVHLCPLK